MSQVPLFGKSEVSSRVEEIVGGGFDLGKFVENFEVLAEAAGGVERLRGLLLSLAVRGLISSQHGKIRPNIAQEGQPFATPEGWDWRLLADCAELGDGPFGSKLKTAHYVPDAGYRVLRLGNIGIGEFKSRDQSYVTREHFQSLVSYHLLDGDILVASLGNPPGRACLVPPDVLPALNKADCFRARVFDRDLSRSYLVMVLNSDYALARASELNRGDTRGRITLSHLRATPIPVPPLAEQKRIVAKVDQLMALCDDLEARQSKKREIGKRLTKSALEALTTAEGPEEFDVAWKRAVGNFEVIVDRAEKVGELRGAIRNLAIRGVLTVRAQTEVPGATLLQQIATEQARRVRLKEARQTDSPPGLTSHEVPFPVPSSWAWARLGHLCWKVADGPHFSPKYVDKDVGVPFLSGRNIKIEGFELETVKHVSREDHQAFCERTKPEPGDVLYTKGGTTGVALVNNLNFEFSVWVHVAVLKLDLANVFPAYVALALNSPHCYAQSQKLTHGTGNRDLGLTRMVLISLPLPPLEEQKRIVAKVEQLMKVCDELEVALRRAEDRAAKLVEAVVQELVA